MPFVDSVVWMGARDKNDQRHENGRLYCGS